MKIIEIYVRGVALQHEIPRLSMFGAILNYNGHEKIITGEKNAFNAPGMIIIGIIKALEALKEPCYVKLHTHAEFGLKGKTSSQFPENRALVQMLKQLVEKNGHNIEYIYGQEHQDRLIGILKKYRKSGQHNKVEIEITNQLSKFHDEKIDEHSQKKTLQPPSVTPKPIIAPIKKKKLSKAEKKEREEQRYEKNEDKIRNSGLKPIKKKGKKTLYLCSKCGNFMLTKRSAVVKNPVCRNCMTGQSFGEEKCIEILNQYKISYEKEKTFKGLRGLNKGKLRFDFYIKGEKRDFLLEIDGEQHKIKDTGGWGGNTKAHDDLKKVFCEQQGIELYRVTYSFGKLISLENSIIKVLKSEFEKLFLFYQ